MNDVLLTVSGNIDPDIRGQIARGERPTADYIAMADTFGADLLDYAGARRLAGRWGRLLAALFGPNALLAWVCFRQRHRYRVLFTDGEQVGIPLALLLKFFGRTHPAARPQHLMIAHILSVPKKQIFFDRLRLHSHIDRFFTYSTTQKQFIEQRWDVPPDRVHYTPFMVDADFFAPAACRPALDDFLATLPPRPLICAVGLEMRDYPTLLRAVADLDVTVVIAAASPWSKRADSTQGQPLPPNVVVRRFSHYELRHLYTVAAFVVLPLVENPFQAGVTTLLEALAMGKAVICTRTSGQVDVIVDGATGLYVPPGDADALRAAVARLLADPAAAERLGRAGRRHVVPAMSLARYADRLNRVVNPHAPVLA